MENSFLCCEHLSQSDWADLQYFTSAHPEGGFLADYIKDTAFNDEEIGAARTYIVRDKATNAVVGYFSLKAGIVAVNEKYDNDEGRPEFDSLPSIELAKFAVNGAYKEAHPDYKGLGGLIFSDFILPIVNDAASIIGVSFLYIFALPRRTLIDNYAKYGFERLPEEDERRMHHRIKPHYDRDCIFMYQTL